MQTIENSDESNLTAKEKFYYSLTKKQKQWIFDKQMELFDQGFGKDQDFVQLACYNETLRLFKLLTPTV